MENKVAELAHQLYLKLPWWKRNTYREWWASNNWDVKGIYDRCLKEARSIIEQDNQISPEKK